MLRELEKPKQSTTTGFGKISLQNSVMKWSLSLVTAFFKIWIFCLSKTTHLELATGFENFWNWTKVTRARAQIKAVGLRQTYRPDFWNLDQKSVSIMEIWIPYYFLNIKVNSIIHRFFSLDHIFWSMSFELNEFLLISLKK